jgi:hypothetical protein
MTSGIIEILTDSVTVQGLVGQNRAGTKYKVYPTVCPDTEDQPYVVVSKTSNNTQSQGKDVDSLLDYPTYDIRAYSKNFRTTEEISEACRAAVDNMASVTDVCEFRRIWAINDYDAFDNDAELYVHILTIGAEQVRPIL